MKNPKRARKAVTGDLIVRRQQKDACTNFGAQDIAENARKGRDHYVVVWALFSARAG